MKIMLLMTLFLYNSLALASNYKVQYIRRGGVLMPVVMPTQKKANKLENGVGMEMKGQVTISGSKAIAYIGSCGNVELNNMTTKNAEGIEVPSEKSKTIKNGSNIILKMESIGSCKVADWIAND